MAYRATGTAGTNSPGGSGNPTGLGLPAGHVADDILELVIHAADTVPCSVNQGYTLKSATNIGTTGRQEVWWKRDSGAEIVPTVTHTGGDACIARIHAFSGRVTTGDPHTAATQNGTVGSKTATSTTLTPAANDDILFAVTAAENVSDTSGGTQGFSGYSGTNPTFTERGDTFNGAGLRDLNGAEATDASTDGSATGARTAAEGWSYSAASTNTIAGMFALAAATAAAAGAPAGPALAKAISGRAFLGGKGPFSRPLVPPQARIGDPPIQLPDGGARPRPIVMRGARRGPFSRPIAPLSAQSAAVSSSQTVDLISGAIASNEAVGTPTLRFTYFPAAIASGQAFGSATIRLTVFPSGITSAEVLGSDRIVLTVAPSAVASAGSVSTGDLIIRTVAPSAIASGQSVSTGDQINRAVTVSGIASSQAFGTPIVSIVGGAQTVSGAGAIASSEALGTPQIIRPGTIGGVGSVVQIFIIEPPTQFLEVRGIPSARAVGVPRVVRTLGPAAIDAAADGVSEAVNIRRGPSARQLADERDALGT